MTLPALPLYINCGPLGVKASLRLALCWLAGGDITDYLVLDVSEDVLASMLLTAAHDNRKAARRMELLDERLAGFDDGYERAKEIYQ